MTETKHKVFLARMSGPVKIGLAFGLAGAVLATIGMLTGFAPLTLRSFVTAVGISAITWGVVSWAVAQAVVEVERDVPEDGERLAGEERQSASTQVSSSTE